MKLTQRRKDFLNSLINIYTRTAKPVHYETLAQEVGVSKWTAYDMLQTLQKTGFLAREYVLPGTGGGRSQIVYTPTEKAYGMIGKTRTDSNVEASVERALETFRTWMERVHTDDIMSEMLEAIQTTTTKVEYCLYALDVLILVLQGTDEEGIRLIKHFVVQAPSGTMRLAAFTGAVFGNVSTSIHSDVSLRVVDLIGAFLKEMDALSDESKELLSEFLARALSSI